ncbi:MAG: ABC transporter substrate-binding protein [Deltaproteobacteria bacterium]
MRPSAAVTVLAAALALALAGCSDRGRSASAKEPASTKTRIRFQLDWVPQPEFGGLYAGLARGYFAAEGLDVQVLKGGASVAVPQLVANDKVEAGVMGADQLLAVRVKGGRLVAVYATYQVSPRALMVHDANPARSLEEVWRGQNPVAVEPGQSYVRWLTARYGTTPPTVPYQGALAIFEGSPLLAQQCFISAEPVDMELLGKKVRTFPVAASGFSPYLGVVAVSEAFQAEHPEAVRALVRALRKGWTDYLADPGAFNPAIAAQNPAMSLAAMNRAAELDRPFIETQFTRRAGLGAMEESRWAELARQLVEIKAIARAPDLKGVFVGE